MIALYGFVRLPPVAVVDAMTLGLRKREKRLIALNEHSVIPQDGDVFLFTSTAAFLRHVRAFRTRRIIALVFDCEERLAELPAVPILDAALTTTLKSIARTVYAALEDESLPHIAVQHKRIDVITPVLVEKKSTGFIHLYNTTLYSISNKQVREQVRQLVFSRMAGKLTATVLQEKAAVLSPKRGKGKDAVQSLIDIVNGELGEKLRLALRDVSAKKPVTVEQAAKTHGVVPYDLRYFMASIAKQKKDAPDGQPKAGGKRR